MRGLVRDIRNSIAGALEGEKDEDAGALVLLIVLGTVVVGIGMGSSVILVVGRNVSPRVGTSVVLVVGRNVSPRVGILVGSVVEKGGSEDGLALGREDWVGYDEKMSMSEMSKSYKQIISKA